VAADSPAVVRRSRVALRGVPAERFEQMRWLARRHALKVARAPAGWHFSNGQAMDLAVEAQRWVCKHPQQRYA
jgi:hypothetical protein